MRDESSRQDLLVRFNAWFAKCLLALWPEDGKTWGTAFAAECASIESPRKQFRWLLGGIPVLLRESSKSFLGSLGRPLGVDRSGALPGPRPRTPRVVVALLLVFFMVLFAQPSTRAVFRSVSEA